jgi:hypothetical protein
MDEDAPTHGARGYGKVSEIHEVVNAAEDTLKTKPRLKKP